MKNKRRMRQWYYVVCVELETIIAADYPATAESSLHDVVHQMLDPIDRHHFPRVICNLVCNVDGWQGFDPKLSAVDQVKNVRRNVRPVKETTFLPKRRNVLKT